MFILFYLSFFSCLFYFVFVSSLLFFIYFLTIALPFSGSLFILFLFLLLLIIMSMILLMRFIIIIIIIFCLGDLLNKKKRRRRLRPDLQQTIPATCAEGHAVWACRRAGNSVIVALEHGDAVAFQGIPCVAIKIVVPSKHDAATQREGYRGDATHDALVCVGHELSVGSDIEKPAARVIRPCAERHPVREEPVHTKKAKRMRSKKKKRANRNLCRSKQKGIIPLKKVQSNI